MSCRRSSQKGFFAWQLPGSGRPKPDGIARNDLALVRSGLNTYFSVYCSLGNVTGAGSQIYLHLIEMDGGSVNANSITMSFPLPKNVLIYLNILIWLRLN